ncbi:MAG: hypothetical protein M9894_30190 [Planctomycetes bacterium]|nr:hypothetical protein [Planctomycetota bacterium]
MAPPGPPARARLLVTGGAPAALDLRGRGVVLVGREPRCDVVLAAGRRLAATLVRLHARWVLRDEGDGAARLLEPGRPAPLGEGAALVLEVADEPARGDLAPIDPAAFWALAGHPATLRGLALVLALGPALEAALARLGVGEPAASRARALLADRARLARERLVAALGRDLGDDPAAWRAALGPGPGLAPAGWTP